MMSLLRSGQWGHILYYAILHYSTNTIQATCDGISTSLTIRRRQEMNEEQCHRPSDGKWRKRITGWLAGHTIHLETEEVACMKRNIALEIGPMTSHLREWTTTNRLWFERIIYFIYLSRTSSISRWISCPANQPVILFLFLSIPYLGLRHCSSVISVGFQPWAS